jgi:ABC-type branched-subunit amino acid transport system ATPase component
VPRTTTSNHTFGFIAELVSASRVKLAAGSTHAVLSDPRVIEAYIGGSIG